jgi:hypothetical protein
MRNDLEIERNLAAYRSVKGELNRLYAEKDFVAFAGGNYFTHSRDFDAIILQLKNAGYEPRNSVLIRVGDEEMDGLDILTGLSEHHE